MREFVLSSGAIAQGGLDYQGELNEEQRAVVTSAPGAALVLAGAGSGKTRTITYRVAWLLEHGVPPENILLLTFTNKAAREMIDRVQTLLGAAPRGLWAGTFHSIANRILRMYGEQTGYGSAFSILDEDDANDLMKLCVKELGISDQAKRFPSASVLRNIISYSTNAQVSIEDVLVRRHPHFLDYLNDIRRAAERYATRKRDGKGMDFDDLLIILLRLLHDHPEVREALANRFAHVLVDEFQDTNTLQADLVAYFSSSHRNILVVGDDAQSIYSFRAAQIKNILDFEKRYSGAHVYRLVTNYRSTPQILSVANAVIKHNTEQFSKDLTAVVHDGDLPVVVPAADARQEAQYIVEQVDELVAGGLRYRDIAVLFRAAFHSQALEFELMRRGIAYEYRGGMKFFERAHIKDAVAHLRVLRNPQDLMAWIRVLRIHPGLGLVTAQKIAEQLSRHESLSSALTHPPTLGAKASQGWRMAESILRLVAAAQTPAAALRSLAGSREYQNYLEAEYPNYRERLEDVEQFALFAEQYNEVGAFLDAVTLTGDFGAKLDDPEQSHDDDDDDSADKMVLSTIHQAKGLEWPAVFVINLADGAFPHERSRSEAGGLEEERRLFYVAVTRARQKLFLTYPITAGFEHVEIRSPSPFLGEIPKKSIEEVRLRTTFIPWGSDDESMIVLNDLGERTLKKPTPTSFLRDIDEL